MTEQAELAVAAVGMMGVGSIGGAEAAAGAGAGAGVDAGVDAGADADAGGADTYVVQAAAGADVDEVGADVDIVALTAALTAHTVAERMKCPPFWRCSSWGSARSGPWTTFVGTSRTAVHSPGAAGMPTLGRGAGPPGRTLGVRGTA